MNLHTPAHSVFGGSVAARVLNCPASVKLIANVPEHLRKASSSYADRGTALHTAMARLIEGECSFDDLVGMTIDDYAITRDDAEDALRPAYAYVDALLTPEAEYFLEAARRVSWHRRRLWYCRSHRSRRQRHPRCRFQIRRRRSRSRALSRWRRGRHQRAALFYAAAARHTFPNFFAGVDDIILTILQPQSIELDAEMESRASR